MGEDLTFQKWMKMNYSPKRLLEEYCSKNALPVKDVRQIRLIMDYAVWLEHQKSNGKPKRK